MLACGVNFCLSLEERALLSTEAFIVFLAALGHRTQHTNWGLWGSKLLSHLLVSVGPGVHLQMRPAPTGHQADLGEHRGNRMVGRSHPALCQRPGRLLGVWLFLQYAAPLCCILWAHSSSLPVPWKCCCAHDSRCAAVLLAKWASSSFCFVFWLGHLMFFQRIFANTQHWGMG